MIEKVQMYAGRTERIVSSSAYIIRLRITNSSTNESYD